jgi:hypothetical protein
MLQSRLFQIVAATEYAVFSALNATLQQHRSAVLIVW